MRAMIVLASAIAMTAAAYSAGYAAEAMPTSVHTMNGMLTDAKGMTLYTWDNDKEADKSACTGMCLVNWPVLAASATDKDMGAWKVISRDDGSKQWSYKGKPIYAHVGHEGPDEVIKIAAAAGGHWHVLTP